LAAPRIALIGIPYDEQSSFARGSSMAPAVVRAAWHSRSSNMYSENGMLIDESAVWDAGDIVPVPGTDMLSSIEFRVRDILNQGLRPICVGGDHSVTYPIIKALSKQYHGLGILHIDAHPDLYDVYEGNRLSHACPFARIMEERLATRLVQVGIRTMNPHQREQATRFKAEVIEMKNWDDRTRLVFSGPVYVSLDIDALDPAFAPGVSHREPGGFTTRQAIGIIQSLKGSLVGADIVEFNPPRDVPGMTDMVCAKMLKELSARMLSDKV
jgi:agmatinase